MEITHNFTAEITQPDDPARREHMRHLTAGLIQRQFDMATAVKASHITMAAITGPETPSRDLVRLTHTATWAIEDHSSYLGAEMVKASSQTAAMIEGRTHPRKVALHGTSTYIIEVP